MSATELQCAQLSHNVQLTKNQALHQELHSLLHGCMHPFPLLTITVARANRQLRSCAGPRELGTCKLHQRPTNHRENLEQRFPPALTKGPATYARRSYHASRVLPVIRRSSSRGKMRSSSQARSRDAKIVRASYIPCLTCLLYTSPSPRD